MSDISIQIVDDQDNPIGAASKEEVWQQGLIHRIARIMVEDPAGNILLQKRVHNKQNWPDCWDNSAAGHVDKDEDYLTAAKREMAEEIGLQNVELELLGNYYTSGTYKDMRLHRFNQVYKVVVSPKTEFRLEPKEVSELRWFSPGDIRELIATNPDQVTDGLSDVFSRYYS